MGRSPECDLILFDRATSRQHARITKSDQGYTIEDLGSTNGTYHNEVRLTDPVLLRRNDEIKVGQEVFLFDPDLDVAVGPDGPVLLVGDLPIDEKDLQVGPSEPDMSLLDRGCLAPLFQVAMAMANRPKQGRILKQTAYAAARIFGAGRIALIWPENSQAQRQTALMIRPEGRRLVIPRNLLDLTAARNQSVIWPKAVKHLAYERGKRIIEETALSVMAIPLKAQGQARGLLYVESSGRAFTKKDLNFLASLGALISPALVGATMVNQLEVRIQRDEEDLQANAGFQGEDPKIKTLLGTAYQVGLTDARILLTGEMGTGKEVLARRIHYISPRRRGPFVSLNCSNFAPGQIESILFGQEAGTLSEEGTPGLFEQADGGTIFLRHINNLPLSCQVELLRTMEEKVAYRVGSSLARPTNFRIISSSGVDLISLIQDGEFREDLYHRLSEVTLELPPLRDMRTDIAGMIKFFLARAARERGLPVPELDPAAAECLQGYPWPGNVGELENLAEKLVMFCVNGRIVLEDLPPDLRLGLEAFNTEAGEHVPEFLADVERTIIRRVLARTNGAKGQAAEILGLTETKFGARMKRYSFM
ncbi:MAG: sigma 54-interacting transcriptional regulator [Pseudomonadota bacterium]